MVNKYSLDEKLKERENAVIVNEIENARRFVKYFVNLMENILNYNYDDLASYFEKDKTVADIQIIKKRYEIISGITTCHINACVKLCEKEYSHPKLKVVEFRIIGKFENYTMNIDQFIHGSVKDEEFITNYYKIIKNDIFKDFKYDWSYNKNKIFKRYVKGKIFTPSQYIIYCINNYIYDNIISSKSKMISLDEFLNSEFSFYVDKKSQRIFDKYFFSNI